MNLVQGALDIVGKAKSTGMEVGKAGLQVPVLLFPSRLFICYERYLLLLMLVPLLVLVLLMLSVRQGKVLTLQPTKLRREQSLQFSDMGHVCGGD